MTAPVNRQIVLAARPAGMAKAADFRLETTPVPEPGPGQILVRNIWMSVDPYMRGRMNDRKSYSPPFEVGKPLDGRAVGQVLKSNHPKLKEGAVVSNMQGWREYFVSAGEGITPVDASLPLPAYLGVLGVPGFTGWYGLKEIGKPKAGETLVVSGAAGATGSLVVQMGKILGCRVVGTAGTDEKCARAARLGADLDGPGPLGLVTAGDPHAVTRRRAELDYAGQRRDAIFSFLIPVLICWAIWLSVTLP